MYILLFTLLFGAGFTAGIFFLAKSSANRQGVSIGKDVLAVDQSIHDLQETSERVFQHLESMVSLDSSISVQSELETLEESLGAERDKLAKLDQQVESLQNIVEKEEVEHNSLKKGKDEATELANSMREKKENLLEEAQRLEAELSESVNQVQSLASSIKPTPEQESALKKISSALDKARDQFNVLAEMHTQASTRFLNLETQYSELDKEFTKLVERELTGE